MLTKAPRGTRDITPDEIYKWQSVEKTIHEVCESFGYKQIRVPVFEHTELFERGVGDTTDVVQKEMYTFLDKGGRSLTLRPEGTAGVVRAYIENNLYAAAAPTKLYYILSCYRYEKPQTGRFREFNQFGTEVFGPSSPQTDAEIIILAYSFLRRLGLKDIKLFINSVGCGKCRPKYSDTLVAYFTQYKNQLCGTCLDRLEKNPMRIIDCKNNTCKKIGHNAPMLIDEQCPECEAHIQRVMLFLDEAGVSYQTDPTIVRGLDYYTQTVFEIKHDDVVICGGGRYNNLVSQLGGPSVPGMGFGLGLERLIMVMDNNGLFSGDSNNTAVYIASLGEEALITAYKAANSLRKAGISAQIDLMDRSIKAQMKYADKIGVKYVLVIGDNEIHAGKASLKNMKTGEEFSVKLESLTDDLKQILK